MCLGSSTPKTCLKQVKDFEAKPFLTWIGFNQLCVDSEINFCSLCAVFNFTIRSAFLTFRNTEALLLHEQLRTSPNQYTLMEEVISIFFVS